MCLLCTLHCLNPLSPSPPLSNHNLKIDTSSFHHPGEKTKLAKVTSLIWGGLRLPAIPSKALLLLLPHTRHGETEALSGGESSAFLRPYPNLLNLGQGQGDLRDFQAGQLCWV